MNAERLARFIVIALAIGLPFIAVIGSPDAQAIEIHGSVSETGGWAPADLTATAGRPIRLRLTSDDVMHGFAVGQSDAPAVDVKPGEVTELTLTFDQPGKYVFYCTRWCGLNHWRMRGTIQVEGQATAASDEPPLYVKLGLDIDAAHPAGVLPALRPSAARGAKLGVTIPAEFSSLDDYRPRSPVETWGAFRGASFTRGLSDQDVWDLVAVDWRSHTTPEAMQVGARLYAENCAACHGESGAGDGVMAAAIENQSHLDHAAKPVADFSDPVSMLGAKPAALQGKIVRGGMGTNMPYWGPIFTEAQTWALVDYLFAFQFEMEDEP